MISTKRLPVLALVVLAALAVGTPALADIQPGKKVVEVWVEDYTPGASQLDSDLAYGIRFAVNANERITYAGEFGYVSLSGEFSDGITTTQVDYSSWFSDFVTDINFASKSKVVPAIFLGLGWAGENADAKSTGNLFTVSVEDAYQSGFTLQAGAALKIQMGKSFELRPGVRWRWFEARDQDDIDTEFLLGFGYRF
jgi:Outer membrane protein beta-barrel domain